jgi:hypothetical protein
MDPTAIELAKQIYGVLKGPPIAAVATKGIELFEKPLVDAFPLLRQLTLQRRLVEATKPRPVRPMYSKHRLRWDTGCVGRCAHVPTAATRRRIIVTVCTAVGYGKRVHHVAL